MANEPVFCTKCGAVISSKTNYCPECGMRVPGRDPKTVEEDKEKMRVFVRARPKWAGIMMAVYGIPFFCLGMYYLIDAQGITDVLWQNYDFVERMLSLGVTRAEFESYLVYSSIAWIISGSSGIISAILCFKRRFYYVALATCIISAIVAVSGLFTLFFGLIAFWIILSSKLGFKEYEAELEKELQSIE